MPQKRGHVGRAGPLFQFAVQFGRFVAEGGFGEQARAISIMRVVSAMLMVSGSKSRVGMGLSSFLTVR